MNLEKMIFDTHAHYEDEKFDEDRDALLKGLGEQGIGYVVDSGSNLETSARILEMVKEYPFLYCVIGVHPSDTGELTEESFRWLEEQVLVSPEVQREKKILGIGEIGLDYYWPDPEPATQKIWFERQMELARKAKLPMVVHSRDAAKDTLDMIKALHGEEIGGDIHCFSYGKEMAREYLNMGFYLGIGGVLTFKNGRKLREVVEYAPLSQLVLETDCPYLAPEPNRGKRNSSLNLPYVVEKLAEIKGVSQEEVIRITTENAMRMYGMKRG